MSTETNINEEDKNSERRTNMNDQNNKDFPLFIMTIIALIFIWILAGFTVFQYTTVLVLLIKLIEINHSNSQTRTPSSSSHVCINCTNEMKNNINMSESQAGDVSDHQHTEVARMVLEKQESSDDHSNVLAKNIAQLPESDVNHINNLIMKDETVAVLIAQTDENSINISTTVQQPDVAVPSIPPTAATTTTTQAIAQKSAFTTENVMKIAVSYSGKERRRVLKITRILQNHLKTAECPNPVFFDRDFQHEICRINGLSHLLSIYRQAQLVIVFLSPTYTDSRYCSGEWRTIAQRFLSNRKNKEATQLLLIKLGQYDMEQLDLVDSDFSLNGMRLSNEEIANIILRRWEIVEANLKRTDQN